MDISLIKKSAEEIITEEELAEVIKKKRPRAYLGFAPTGKLHIGYFIPAVKMRDFLNSGFDVTFLIADLHAHLDDLKTPWELLNARSEYYERAFRAMLKAIGANVGKVKFVRGSHFQYDKKYVEDLLRLAATVTLSRAKRAAAEIVRFGKEPKLGGFIYPLMQAVDVPALKADVAFGGIDQRGPYMFAREVLPLLGYKKPVCVFTPLLPGLGGEKMSASVPHSRVDIFDSEEDVKKKMERAFCPPRVERNGVLAFFKHVIFRLKNNIIVEREKKYGGDISYTDYTELEKDYIAKKIHPIDLKRALAKEINILLTAVREEFGDTEIVKRAYP